MELRFLVSLAIKKRRIPKLGDVSQAFCQSFLPDDKIYICTPPQGCPLTQKNTYWRLRKTLYGLKRSPRHWYELVKKILTSIGMKQSKASPCIFYGTIENKPPLYLGFYVDDFIYFSESEKVEEHFENEFQKHVLVTFDKEVDYFLGIKFNTKKTEKGHVSIKLSQAAYIDELCKQTNLHSKAINTPQSPYRSGLPIDSIPNVEYNEVEQKQYTLQMQTIIGSLNWLSVSTRPDITTVTAMLAKYPKNPSKGHIDAALRVVKYLKGTKNMGIEFSSESNNYLQSFLQFPLPQHQLTGLCDANWEPQDQSKPSKDTPPPKLELFKSRSMSGYIMWCHGPLMWISKRQTYTARSLAKAKIYATDESMKNILHLMHIINEMNLTNEYMKGPVSIWNDNHACVCWSKNTTTKGLRHVQIQENAVRESIASGLIQVKHVEGKRNPSDIFTKEDKDTEHFIEARNSVMFGHEEHNIKPCHKTYSKEK